MYLSIDLHFFHLDISYISDSELELLITKKKLITAKYKGKTILGLTLRLGYYAS